MGTNYYWQLRDQPKSKPQPCPHCGHEPEAEFDEGIHIGKSSGGWCFALRVYPRGDFAPQYSITDLNDWIDLWSSDPQRAIVDEYGVEHSPEEMLAIIRDRSFPRGVYAAFDYERNHAVPGPNGLVRHKLGDFCIRHGEGTYDIVVGDFS